MVSATKHVEYCRGGCRYRSLRSSVEPTSKQRFFTGENNFSPFSLPEIGGMSDSRRPDLIFHICPKGKKTRKVELFSIRQWPDKVFLSPTGRRVDRYAKKYRIRVAGKWFRDDAGRDICFSRYEFRDVLWKSMNPAWWK